MMRTILTRSVCLCLLALAMALVGVPRQVVTGQEDPEQQTTVRIYHLRMIAASEAQSVVQTMLASESNARLSVDERSNSMIVMATDEAHEMIESLLQVLDAIPPATESQARNVQLQVYWIGDLTSWTSPDTPLENAEIPEAISELVHGRLSERLALGDTHLVSQLYLQTVVDPSGEREGRIDISGVTDRHGLDLMLGCRGFIQSDGAGAYLIDIELDVQIYEFSSQFGSTIRTRPEQPVCLALANTGRMQSLFVILLTEYDD